MPSLPSITSRSVFNSRLDVPPPPPGFVLTGQAIRDWLAAAKVATSADGILFGYTVGTLTDATPDDRDKPRLFIDDAGRYLGLGLWIPERQAWSIGGQVGQLMTLVRVKPSLADDLAARPLAGWQVADGTAPGIPNLHTNTNFFTGTAPNWDVYTVAYTG